MLKIIGGKFKNRSIHTPKGDRTRPTSALVRKAVFDICQSEINGAHFLDLFAGSGAMGIEALSRGAASATFVDEDRFAIQCIHHNLKSLSLIAEVLRLDAEKAIKLLSHKRNQFELIYVDPPYSEDVSALLKVLEEAALLPPEGLLFLEQGASTSLKLEHLQHFKLVSQRKYGDTLLFTFRVCL